MCFCSDKSKFINVFTQLITKKVIESLLLNESAEITDNVLVDGNCLE